MRGAVRLVALSVASGLAIGPMAPPLSAQGPSPVAATTAEAAPPPATTRPSAGAWVGAVAVNVFRVPGKTLLCGFGSVLAGGLMILTFGTQYRPAGDVLREGCGGKWVIGPSDLDRDVDAPKFIYSREPS